jgi:predicted secreted acid phosphatase
MFRPGVFLLVAWMWAASGLAATASREPANLDALKQEIQVYVDSGRYQQDIAAVAGEARVWLERRAAQGGKRLAVVFDLDETLISNWSHMQEMGFAYVPAAWTAWVRSARGTAIEPVREVYRLARRLGVEVVFLTGRLERDRIGTKENLRAIGCGDYLALVCKADGAAQTTEKFKTEARQKLESQGYVIIANLGDQDSDLAGGHAERAFKLPNPFYLTK